MFGLLSLDKPAGVTSRDVVNQVQRLVRPVKVGHAGTLDPLATGVLVIGLGLATRLVEYVQRMPKTYLATFQLGKQSDTEDIEGTVIELASPPVPSEPQIQAALPQFLGTIDQMPPAFSALKVGGKRAYSLARQGQPVELAPRPVEIHALDLIEYMYPALRLRIVCGSGTYVRSLGRDIARRLGTEAVMSALRRESIGPFTAGEAIDPRSLSLDLIHQHLRPPLLAVASLPSVVVTADEVRQLAQGKQIANRWSVTSAEVAVADELEGLVAIAVATPQSLAPLKCFVAQPDRVIAD